jgi:spore maturation protein CgeB
MKVGTTHILIVGSTSPHALETYYERAFVRRGARVSRFDSEARLDRALAGSRVLNRLARPFKHHWAGRDLLQYVRQARGLSAVLVFKGMFLTRQACQQARHVTGVPWLNLNPDSPFDLGLGTSTPHIRRSLDVFDAYLIWSHLLVARLQRVGCPRVEYVPFGFDPLEHFPGERPMPELARTVSFVGAFDEHRASVLEELSDLPVKIYGARWDELRRGSPLRARAELRPIFGEELRSVITSSAASINILRPQNEGSHNMRTFEVPAMGGVMITNRTAEQEAFFPHGESSLAYGSVRELRSTVEALLRGEYDTAAIRRRALARVANHSYEARAAQILTLIDELC